MYLNPLPIQTAQKLATIASDKQCARNRRFSEIEAKRSYYAESRQIRFSRRLLGCTIQKTN